MWDNTKLRADRDEDDNALSDDIALDAAFAILAAAVVAGAVYIIHVALRGLA